MARRTVVEVQCSRCERKELVEQPDPSTTLTITAAEGAVSRAFFAVMGDGTKVEFEDLCNPCRSAVKSHLEAIGKKIEGVSPERKKKDTPKKEEAKRAEEIQSHLDNTAPTPPKSYSMEQGAKKKGPSANA